MAHHSAHHPHQPLNLRLRRTRRRWEKRFPRTAYAGRRIRAHGPFTVYAVISSVLMVWISVWICRIPS
jgi:hypothetical protein